MNNVPHFIGIGAHKCGTSWLFNCLYEHAEIFIKEKIDFFYVDKKKALGKLWYQDHFNEKSALQKVKGELSTVYFFSEESAKEIYRYKPNIKLIVLLRNPIDRAYSHYLQDIKIGHIPKDTSFKTAIEQNPTILKWGNYKNHLESYFRYFNKEQLHIILFDDIKKNPKKVLRNVYTFLCVNSSFIPLSVTRKINIARIPKNTQLDFQLRKLSQSMKKNPFGEKLWWFLKHSWLTKTYYSLNTTKNLDTISSETRTKLYTYFYNDIKYIQEKLRRDDINWN